MKDNDEDIPENDEDEDEDEELEDIDAQFADMQAELAREAEVAHAAEVEAIAEQFNAEIGVVDAEGQEKKGKKEFELPNNMPLKMDTDKDHKKIVTKADGRPFFVPEKNRITTIGRGHSAQDFKLMLECVVNNFDPPYYLYASSDKSEAKWKEALALFLAEKPEYTDKFQPIMRDHKVFEKALKAKKAGQLEEEEELDEEDEENIEEEENEINVDAALQADPAAPAPDVAAEGPPPPAYPPPPPPLRGADGQVIPPPPDAPPPPPQQPNVVGDEPLLKIESAQRPQQFVNSLNNGFEAIKEKVEDHYSDAIRTADPSKIGEIRQLRDTHIEAITNLHQQATSEIAKLPAAKIPEKIREYHTKMEAENNKQYQKAENDTGIKVKPAEPVKQTNPVIGGHKTNALQAHADNLAQNNQNPAPAQTNTKPKQ